MAPHQLVYYYYYYYYYYYHYFLLKLYALYLILGL